jgi:hypothetical protein
MVQPVEAALAAVASPSVHLWFSVSGEMGLSNFLNAREWRTLLQETRSQLKQKPWKVRLKCTGSCCVVLCLVMLQCAMVCYTVIHDVYFASAYCWWLLCAACAFNALPLCVRMPTVVGVSIQDVLRHDVLLMLCCSALPVCSQ